MPSRGDKFSRVPAAPNRWLLLGGLLVASFLAAAIGGLSTSSSVDSWYRTLERPAFAPPDWVFGPVWTLLYIAMAVAAWRVWTRLGPWSEARRPMILYAIQLLLNTGWSAAFFGLRSPGFGLLWILFVVAAVAATTIIFVRVDRTAGLLFLPYLAWVAFATILNAGFWILN